MIFRRLEWTAPEPVAAALRDWFTDFEEEIDLTQIAADVASKGDAALLELTARFDATETAPEALPVALDEADDALDRLDPDVEAALRIAVENVAIVASAQLVEDEKTVELPQGQTVTVGEVPVAAVGIYVPGGRASYPSTVVMGCVTARVAGVERIVMVAPPGPNGRINQTTLAAASICGVDEIYAVGGAQAIFALARGTESIAPVNVIAGPGNVWVQAAKKAVFGEVGIDSLAGPSDLMVILDETVDPAIAAIDLCAQAEHGSESPLVLVGPDDEVLDRVQEEVGLLAANQPSVKECRMASVAAPSSELAVDLANAFAPEHLQLMDESSALLASRVSTAGCVFTGPLSGTAFGDYVAGSNHILPTDGTGKIFGPVSPSTFRRRTAKVSLDAAAVAELAGPLDALARAEGLPVHGMSATARTEHGESDQ